jgi:hypothetical protein
MHSKMRKVMVFCAGLVAVTGVLAVDNLKDDLQKNESNYGPVAKHMMIYNDTEGSGPGLPPGSGVVKPIPSGNAPSMTLGGPERGISKGTAISGGVVMASVTTSDRMEAGLRTLARELR